MTPARVSANDAVWRWKLLAGLSSVAVVGVLAWHLLGTQDSAVRAELALATQAAHTAPLQTALMQPATVLAPAVADAQGSTSAVMIRDPRLDQWIAAHQQPSAASTLQMPASFLRDAAFERPAH